MIKRSGRPRPGVQSCPYRASEGLPRGKRATVQASRCRATLQRHKTRPRSSNDAAISDKTTLRCPPILPDSPRVAEFRAFRTRRPQPRRRSIARLRYCDHPSAKPDKSPGFLTRFTAPSRGAPRKVPPGRGVREGAPRERRPGRCPRGEASGKVPPGRGVREGAPGERRPGER